MSDAPESGAAGFGRLAQLVKDHPLLAVASALGSVGTFAAGMAGVIGLFMDGNGSMPTEPGGTLVGAPAYEYAVVSDDGGEISAEVPTAWASIRTNGWHARSLAPIPEDTRIGPGIQASTNNVAWGGDLKTPGMFLGASRQILEHLSADEILGHLSFTGCETGAPEPYTSTRLTGKLLRWECPPTGTEWRVLAATPTESRDYLVYLQVKIVAARDEEAFNRILNTFEVDLDA